MPSKLRWSLQDELSLRALYRRRSIAWLAKKLGRSEDSIKCKANELGITQICQTHSLRNLINDTGYNWKQLLKARNELNQNWTRLGSGPKSPYAITEEQKTQLLAHLAKPGPKWSTKPGRKPTPFWSPAHKLYKCLNCQSSKNKHQGSGLCCQCYQHIRKIQQRFHFYKTLTKYWRLTSKLNTNVSTIHPITQLQQIPNNTPDSLRTIVFIA